MRFEGERARELGRLGGRGRQRKLTLARVKDELGELKTDEDAHRWLRLIGQWAAAGLLGGAVAGAMVRGVEVFSRMRDNQEIKERFQALQRQLDDLKAGRPAVGVMR